MRLKYGTLARVHNPRHDYDEEAMTSHGDLWLYQYTLDGGQTMPDLHSFKSLATGFEYHWYDEEIEVLDDGD